MLLPIHAPVVSVAFVDSASSSTPSLTIPVTAKAGDFAFIVNRSVNAVAAVTPAGWTLLLNQLSVQRATVLWKTLESSDVGATVTLMNSSFENAYVFVFRSTGSTVTVGSELSSGSTGDPTAIEIDASGLGGPVYVFGATLTSGGFTTSFSTFDNLTGYLLSDTEAKVGYAKFEGSGQSCTIDMGDIGDSSVLLGFYARFT